VKKPPRAGNKVCHAAFVRLLGGYEKSRSYTKLFVINDVGTAGEGIELHRPRNTPMQSVNENAQVNKIARMADRYIEVGRTSCPESRREYRGNEETNSIFMSTIKMFALCKSSNDLDMMSKNYHEVTEYT
jgi:hypothetical protein